jgi:hypothetical protein
MDLLIISWCTPGGGRREGLPSLVCRITRSRRAGIGSLSALSNSALRRPRGKITINLAPARVRKERPSFDLAIAFPFPNQFWCFISPIALTLTWLPGTVSFLRGCLRRLDPTRARSNANDDGDVDVTGIEVSPNCFQDFQAMVC